MRGLARFGFLGLDVAGVDFDYQLVALTYVVGQTAPCAGLNLWRRGRYLSPGVGLEGRDGCLEPGRAPLWRERNELVVDAGGRGGEGVDVGGLAGLRIGTLDGLPDLGQQIGIERGGLERVRQALRALAEE